MNALAVAIGPQQENKIGADGAPGSVMPYVHGLIEGLGERGQRLGTSRRYLNGCNC